jgi:hypothetical protein
MEGLQQRIDVFNKELQKLLDKHSFGIASEALIVDGLVKTKVVVVDRQEQSSYPPVNTKNAEKRESQEVKK